MSRKEQNKILDDKIESNVNQYKVDGLNAEISAFSSGDLNKYEFLTRKDLNYKPNALDKARVEFSPLGRAFNEGLDKTIPNYQEEGVIKLLKKIRDTLAGGINIPPGPPGPQGPQSPPGPPGPIPLVPSPIIPKPSPSSPPRLRLRPKLPSERKESDYNDINKQLDDAINNIKSKQTAQIPITSLRTPPTQAPQSPPPSRIPAPIITPLRPISTQISITPTRRPPTQAPQSPPPSRIPTLIPTPIIKPVRPISKSDLSIRKRPEIPISIEEPSKPSKTSKPSIKVSDNLKIYGPSAGTRSVIKVKELDIENSYDKIKYLENKLRDTINYDEYSKILNDIDQIKKYIPKKEKELNNLRKEFLRIPRIDQDEESSGNGFGKRSDISAKKFDIKNDYNNIIAFNYMLKDNKLTHTERKNILERITRIKENVSKKEQELDKIKKDLKLIK